MLMIVENHNLLLEQMTSVDCLHLSLKGGNFPNSTCSKHVKAFPITYGNRVGNSILFGKKINVLRFRPLSASRMTFEMSKMQAVLGKWTGSNNPCHLLSTVISMVPAVGIVTFSIWGLELVLRWGRSLVTHKNDGWKKSRTYHALTFYLRPLLLWTAVLLTCRALDLLFMSSEVHRIIKLRLLNFFRSLSTVLTFAYCLSSGIRDGQRVFFQTKDPNDARNMGFDLAVKVLYSAVWIGGASLFIELLGVSTQKWLTAGGVGTLLLTLAGREIVTNFLSSAMIHATRPFVVNEWIQTRIEGSHVSGIVEHVGWWSPTVVRGEDREAVYIPNHQFTVNVVRNLSQKSHWRIKTHLAVSHLDAGKINSIVADMRKVLAKNPQVEQQRLHRRVFLESIHPENQSLVVLVSCFVRTSRVEEYLCVKEAILLDLLRVVRHHGARLATPVRTLLRVPVENEFGTAAPPRPPSFLLAEHAERVRVVRKDRHPQIVDVKVPASPAHSTAKSNGAASFTAVTTAAVQGETVVDDTPH